MIEFLWILRWKMEIWKVDVSIRNERKLKYAESQNFDNSTEKAKTEIIKVKFLKPLQVKLRKNF